VIPLDFSYSLNPFLGGKQSHESIVATHTSFHGCGPFRIFHFPKPHLRLKTFSTNEAVAEEYFANLEETTIRKRMTELQHSRKITKTRFENTFYSFESDHEIFTHSYSSKIVKN
jgi:hypothetical protein